MFRISPSAVSRNVQKIVSLSSQHQSPLHTTSSILKWGDVYIPPDLKRWEEPFPKDFKEHPDRDLVNFPHPVTRAYPPKTRYGFFPDSFFTIFYPKTGVTGSYLFYGGFALYLIQKEWFVVTEEMRLVYLSTILAFSVYKLFGASISKYMNERAMEKLAFKEKYVTDNTKALQDAIATQQQYVASYTALPPLIAEAKRENAQLQLESQYRQRLLKAHSEVKRRLDYMADLEEAKRRFQRRYMVQWIVEQVKKSITPQQEKVLIGQCVADLKALAQRANV